jgi:hypothetical protein
MREIEALAAPDAITVPAQKTRRTQLRSSQALARTLKIVAGF